MIVEEIKLYSKDKKGKVRVIHIALTSYNDVYHVSTETGLLGGTMVLRPTDIITEGKVKRTIEEQARLKYNSKIKKYKDRGNKTLDDLGYSSGDIHDFLKKHLPEEKTDQNGVKKAMKAISYKEINNYEELFNTKSFLVSAKLDGVRCQLYKSDGRVRTASRGGTDYDVSAGHIVNDENIIAFFKKYPDVILDGELYIHGCDLSEISGIARTKKAEKLKDKKKLNFHVYEIMNDEKAANRYMTLKKLSKDFELCKYVILHDQVVVSSIDEVFNLYDQYILDGYEGAVAKESEGLYVHGHDTGMIKFKEMEDAEFLIAGIQEKKRPEDFVFIMQTVDGKTFEAKPKGTAAERLKMKLTNNIGKMATIQYFNWTNSGVPNLPVFKCVRNYE